MILWGEGKKSDFASSHQPTVQIVQNEYELTKYLVYVGHRTKSYDEDNIVWAYLDPSMYRFRIQLCLGPKRLSFPHAAFFNRSATTICVATWLQKLMERYKGQAPTPKGWTLTSAFLLCALCAVLKECAGNVLLISASPRRSLQETNAADFPDCFTSLHRCLNGDDVVRPRYWTCRSSAGDSRLPRCVFSFEDSNDSKATVEQQRHMQLISKQPDLPNATCTKKRTGVAATGSNGIQDRNQDTFKKQAINARQVVNQPVPTHSNPSPTSNSTQQVSQQMDSNGVFQKDIATPIQKSLHQEISNNFRPLVSLSDSPATSRMQTDANPGSAVGGTSGDSHTAGHSGAAEPSNGHAVLLPWAAEFERLLLRPVKEKAVNEIEFHLREWRDGLIDEDALEKKIGTSLLDVRVSLRMQGALVRSHMKAPVNNGQKNTMKDSDKRRLYESDGGSSQVEHPPRRIRRL